MTTALCGGPWWLHPRIKAAAAAARIRRIWTPRRFMVGTTFIRSTVLTEGREKFNQVRAQKTTPPSGFLTGARPDGGVIYRINARHQLCRSEPWRHLAAAALAGAVV